MTAISTRRDRIDSFLRGVVSLALLLCGAVASAQMLPDRQNPLADDTVLFRPYARMTGTMTDCVHPPNLVEQFGRSIWTTGDLDGDRIMDFAVGRYRCDTAFHDFSTFWSYPEDVLLYYGVKGGIPDVASGQRIGPREVGSTTAFLAAGDWDGDGYKDIATRIHLFADSSYGNTEGYTLSSIVIFWGSPSGYTIDDTTRLACGAQAWLGGKGALSGDFDADGVEDLFVWIYGGGFSNGAVVILPSVLMYRGHHGARWGKAGISRLPDWGFWRPGSITRIGKIDQDCDGVMDVVLYYDGDGNTSTVSVVYGRPKMLPDTLDAQLLNLSAVLGMYALLTDVTGDNTPELVVSCGDERARVYAGRNGERLIQQFGSGNDPVDPDNGRYYSRPWISLDLPHRLHDGWSGAAGNPIYNFGDVNLDGYRDVWTYSDPFVICYGSGKWYDSRIDAMFDTRAGDGFRTLAWLGDIDGSGYESFAVSDAGVPGSIQFMKVNRQWDIFSDVIHPLPHPTGFVCQPGASVPASGGERPASPRLELAATPNPTRDGVTISWRSDLDARPLVVTVTDPAGRELARLMPPAGAAAVVWNGAARARGLHYVTLQAGSASETIPIVLD